MDTNLALRSNVLIVLYDAAGKIKTEEQQHNRVPTVGLNHIAALLQSSAGVTEMGWMAIGSGATAPAAGDTSLVSQLARVALTGRTRTGNAVTHSATFPAGTGTGSVAEAGIFNASSGGTMLARVVFTAKNKAAGDSLLIQWTVTVSDDGV